MRGKFFVSAITDKFCCESVPLLEQIQRKYLITYATGEYYYLRSMRRKVISQGPGSPSSATSLKECQIIQTSSFESISLEQRESVVQTFIQGTHAGIRAHPGCLCNHYRRTGRY